MDIRKELNKLNKATLKDLVVRHDLHYYIKKTGKKSELVEGLAQLYESIKNIHLNAKDYKIQIMPKFTKQQKKHIKKIKQIRHNKNLQKEYDEKEKQKVEKEMKQFLNQRIKQYNVDMDILADYNEKNTKLNNFPSRVRNLKALERNAQKEKEPWQLELLQKYNNLLQTNKLFSNRMKRYAD